MLSFYLPVVDPCCPVTPTKPLRIVMGQMTTFCDSSKVYLVDSDPGDLKVGWILFLGSQQAFQELDRGN